VSESVMALKGSRVISCSDTTNPNPPPCRDNFTEAEAEYIDELIVSVFTSFVFTVGTVCFTLFRMCRGRMRWRPDCRKVNGGNDNGLHAEDTTDAVIPTSHMSSSNTDEDFLRAVNRIVVKRTVYPDGSETIRNETFHPDGSCTITITFKEPPADVETTVHPDGDGNDNGFHAEDTTDAVIPTSHMSSSSTDDFLSVDNRVDVEITVHPDDGFETIRNEKVSS
jgi:hypothetical protein